MGVEEDTDEDLIQLYDEKVGDFDRWEQRKKDIENRKLGRVDGTENAIGKRFDSSVETEQDHDDLLRLTITAFGPRSTIYKTTGWKLLGVEPLYEVDPHLRNPDAMMGHDDRDVAVTVECKTGLSSPQKAIQQIRAASQVVRDRSDYLSKKAGCSFSEIEPVLCVPGHLQQKAKRAIEQEEQDGDVSQPIYLWTLHRFKGDELQLNTQINTRTENESKHNSGLASILGGDSGVEIGGKVGLTPEFFPDSHPYTVMDHVFSELLVKRERSDNSVRKFTRGEVYEFINDQRTVPHYEVATIAEMMTNDLLVKMEEFGLIDSTSPESGAGKGVETYEYDSNLVEGKSASRIRSNLNEAYKSVWSSYKADSEAKREAAQEFRESNPRLDQYYDES